MTKVLFAFLILLASVYLGILVHHDSGYVMIAVNHWTIETSFWFAVFGLILVFLMLHLFLKLCHQLAKTPGTFNRWHKNHLAQKSQAMTRKGLIEYSEGYWLKAKNHLIKALPHSDSPLINYLTAARAAQKMGDSQLRDHYLREAQQSMPEAKIAVELTQAQLQLANQQWEQALATLKHLQGLAPKHPYVLKLLMHLYEEVKDWKQLIDLLPVLKKNQIISPSEYDQLQLKTYLQAIHEMAKQDQTQALASFFDSLPKPLAHNPLLIAEYVHFLIKEKDYATTEALLRPCLKKEFNDQLIELYGLIPNQKNQLSFAESLLKKNPHSASLYLCLGRLCNGQHLWGKAKYYLEQAIGLNPSPITYYELARLHDKLQDSSLAFTNYKKGLILASK